VLSTLAQKINSEDRYYAIIHGHTDNVGDPEANKRLAAKRANAVLAYLIEQGVDQSRLKILAQGEDKPVAANDTEEGRGLNRRVEVLLLKKEN
jgi:outer membrane protein OmpA-like peptidoglycan-associated protein